MTMGKSSHSNENYYGRSLSTAAYQSIYANIVTLRYTPGQHLDEAELVEKMGIDPTPVREALMWLTDDQLVEFQPDRGFVVSPLTLQKTKAAFEALDILELGMVSLVVRHRTTLLLDQMHDANLDLSDAIADMDIYRLMEANSIFHDAFARCSDNIHIVQSLKKLRCGTNRLAFLSYKSECDPSRPLQEYYASVIDQHNQMIDAARSRDEILLRNLVRNHIDLFKNRVISCLTAA